MDRYVKVHSRNKYRKSLYYPGLILLGIACVVFAAALCYTLIFFTRYQYNVVPSLTTVLATELRETEKIKNTKGQTILAGYESTVHYKLVNDQDTDSLTDPYLAASEDGYLYLLSPLVAVNNFKEPVYIRANVYYYENGERLDNSQYRKMILDNYIDKSWEMESDGYLYLRNVGAEQAELAVNMQGNTDQIRIFNAFRIVLDNPVVDPQKTYQLTVWFEYTTDLSLWRD